MEPKGDNMPEDNETITVEDNNFDDTLSLFRDQEKLNELKNKINDIKQNLDNIKKKVDIETLREKLILLTQINANIIQLNTHYYELHSDGLNVAATLMQEYKKMIKELSLD